MQENLNPLGIVTLLPGIIVALNQVLKTAGMDSRWTPIVNIAMGFIALPAFVGLGLNWYYSIMGSLILGLSAGGFYDLGKKTVLGK